MNGPLSGLKSGSNRLPFLVLGALGVVFGDIGTSPLYTLQACFFGIARFPLTAGTVLSVTSTVLWSLISVVAIKYAFVVMRADHRGEGGILALTTLAESTHKSGRLKPLFPFFGIIGAALLYSDGIITPAISVLSAVEGLNAVTPLLEKYIIPVSIAVLTALFLVQSKGTGRLSAFFGPIIILWFVVLALLGIRGILRQPGIIAALDPLHALRFFAENPRLAFFILSAAFLAVTGAEVLYADMGHFGKKPIRLAWWCLVFPALVVNYLGQSAQLLGGFDGGATLFYGLCPKHFLIPLIFLSTTATIIASQAVISGMFSLARQAVNLDYWPRLRQIHTSPTQVGQVYMPFVNAMLFAGTLALILIFKRSDRLASAYGIAISATMLLTTILIVTVAFFQWKRGHYIALALLLFFLPMDLVFFCANFIKLVSGGWIVVLVTAVLFALMATWRQGRRILHERIRSFTLHISLFMESMKTEKPARVPGTAVFLTGNLDGTARALLHNFKHNKIIHETVAIVTVSFEEIPYVEESRRITHTDLGLGMHKVVLRFGFFEHPDVPAALSRLSPVLELKPMQTTYFLGGESLAITDLPGMQSWRKKVFRFLSTNANTASDHFSLPANRVVQIGLHVEI